MKNTPAIEKKVADYIDIHEEELFSLLSMLLQFDTQNFITYGLEKECQNYIAGLYRSLGLETDIYSPDSIPGIKEHPGYLPGRGMEDRPNVTGIHYGSDTNYNVMLAAHTDTMPVGDPAKWTVDPFGGIIRDGRIYGLGAGDNKFGIAGSFFAVKALQECGIKLKKTVLLTAYTDEEYGGGDGALAACLKYPCETYVNLDGGGYEIWLSSLGGAVFEIGVNANYTSVTSSPIVDALYRIKTEVEVMGRRRCEELNRNRFYAGSGLQREAFKLIEFVSGSKGCNLDSGKLSFVIYTDKPKEQIYSELDEIIKKIKPELDKANLSTTGFIPTTRFFNYGETAENDSAVKIMIEAAEKASGKEVKQCGACLSDLSIFLTYGSRSSFNFGIFRDFSLKGGAHQPDEYIECRQFIEHTKALALFLINYCGME